MIRELSLPYGFGATFAMPLDHALERVRSALADEGFGVLTEIDIRATLKKKLDVDFRPYVILGACNPALAHRALGEELEIGLLLPCNVVVHAGDRPDQTVVLMMDPEAALSLADNPVIAGLASEVRSRLQRVLVALDPHR